MARRTSSTLTEVELEFMHILWEAKEVSPEDMQKALLEQNRSLTGGSIRKMFLILMKKRYIKRVKLGKKYIYSPIVQKNQANGNMIRDLVNRAFDGSVLNMVASLLDSKYAADDLEKIEQLIAEKKKEKGK